MLKGSTPAGMHRSIMVDECMYYLGLQDDSIHCRNDSSIRALPETRIDTLDLIIAIDCTLGYGGHSLEILKRISLKPGSQLISLDQDVVEMKRTELRLKNEYLTKFALNINHQSTGKYDDPALFQAYNLNFANLLSLMQLKNLTGKVDCILADLGYSSMQIDNPDRGFSYKLNGTLDMRMNATDTSVLSAYDYTTKVNASALSSILLEYGDEPLHHEIAKRIKMVTPRTTLKLRQCVQDVYNHYNVNRNMKEDVTTALARTMQAIRIEVNDEMSSLDSLLESIPLLLKPGERVVA